MVGEGADVCPLADGGEQGGDAGGEEVEGHDGRGPGVRVGLDLDAAGIEGDGGGAAVTRRQGSGLHADGEVVAVGEDGPLVGEAEGGLAGGLDLDAGDGDAEGRAEQGEVGGGCGGAEGGVAQSEGEGGAIEVGVVQAVGVGAANAGGGQHGGSCPISLNDRKISAT